MKAAAGSARHSKGGDVSSEEHVIKVHGLTKRYRAALAVDALGFTVRPGTVTGFLGPNGAGKSTTMRMILGLDAPDAGHARIGGRRYRELHRPLREVGALLEAKAFHPGRSAAAHLTALAAAALAVYAGVVFVIGELLVAVAPSAVSYVPLAIVGDSLGVSRPSPDALSPWTGLAVLCAYASASLLTGAWLLTRRDA
jgi:energy-coupling factor transporter ATP-binding protein EcfA2